MSNSEQGHNRQSDTQGRRPILIDKRETVKCSHRRDADGCIFFIIVYIVIGNFIL